MSILFLPPQSAGSVTIADATETTSGKIRIATSAEATAGTNDVTAMTPAKVKSVIDASLVGGVTYKGTLDASAPADLSNATKGDLYIISVAGTYAGKTWAVGDHLLVNADMGGTLDSSKIDKVDNTDAVTSVAGRTGAVTLSTADISGLATVASTGAYSDLTGAPTLGTASAEDVGTGAGNVVQLDGTAKLPAVDGSQLTNLPAPTLELNDLTDVTFTAGSGIDNYVLTYDNGTGLWGAEATAKTKPFVRTFTTALTANQITTNISQVYDVGGGNATFTIPSPGADAVGGFVIIKNNNVSTLTVTVPAGASTRTFTVEPGKVRCHYWASTSSLVEFTASHLENLNDVDLTGLANGDVLIYNSTSGKWEAGSTPATPVALDDLTDVTITAASTGEVLRYDGAEWVDAQLAYSDLSGTPTLATVATTGAYSDLSGTPTLATVATTGAYSDLSGTPTLGTAAALNVGTSANNVVQLDGTGKLPAVDGSQLTNLPSGASALGDLTDVTITAASTGEVLRYDGAEWVDAQLAYSDLSGTPTLGTASAEDVGTSAGNVVQLDGSARLPAVDGSQLTNLPSGASALDDLTDVTITAATSGEVLRYNGSAWVDAQLAYSDLSGTPTLGTASAEDVGTSAGNVVQLNGSAQLPAVDGSLLTNLPAPSVLYTYSAQSTSFTAAAGYHYSLNTSSSALTVTLPAVSTVSAGAAIRIKLKDATNGATLTPNGADTIDGLSSFSMTNTKQSLTLVSDGTSDWEII